MAGIQGRRATDGRRPPSGVGEGAICYTLEVGGEVFERWLARPSDWATVPYVLGISGGLPAWLPASDGTVLTGFGNSYGNNFGGFP